MNLYMKYETLIPLVRQSDMKKMFLLVMAMVTIMGEYSSECHSGGGLQDKLFLANSAR